MLDKARFFNTSEGSLEECRYYVMLASDLGYGIDRDAMLRSLDEVSRMLHAYAESIRKNAAGRQIDRS